MRMLFAFVLHGCWRKAFGKIGDEVWPWLRFSRFLCFYIVFFFNCVVFFNCVGHLPSGSYLKSTLYYTLAAKPDSWVGLSPGMAVISPLSKQWCHCLWNLLIVFFLTIGALSFSHSAKLFDWNTIGSMKCSPPYTRNLISSSHQMWIILKIGPTIRAYGLLSVYYSWASVLLLKSLWAEYFALPGEEVVQITEIPINGREALVLLA